MQVSIVSHFLGAEEESVPRLAAIGYRGVEIERGATRRFEAARFKELLNKNGIAPVCVMGSDAGIADDDPAARKERVEHLKGIITWAARVGAPVVETVPIWFGKHEDWQGAFDRAVESYKQAGKFAADSGVAIAIEPVNRAETRLVLTLDQGVAMAKAVGLPVMRVMGDTYHMNMTEADMSAAARRAGGFLAHFHFSDNDRLPPGVGFMDLMGIVSALQEVGYEGALSHAEVRAVGEREECARYCLGYTQSLIAACEMREQLNK